jgi:hypothetical protein
LRHVLAASFREVDWGQDLFDALPVLLQAGREFEALVDVVWVFIDGEAGRVGGDLEEDPARPAET